jgi:diadenylate cyclase
VSEETGKVSVATGGKLHRNVDGEYLRNMLIKLQDKTVETKRFRLLRGKRDNNEKVSDK